jgi:adenylate kinase
VLLGAPGVGKGTQATLLSQRLGACHLSTGDLFRAARDLDAWNRSDAMNDAVVAMQRGELVPDLTVIALVRERVACLRCRAGFLLDGFPRTLAQARALERMLGREHVLLEAVVRYELEPDLIVDRLAGRRVCGGCGTVYHLDRRPPERPGVCDRCGAVVNQREDDRPAAIRVRMDKYERETEPLVEYYEDLGLLRTVPAVGSADDICARTLAALGW